MYLSTFERRFLAVNSRHVPCLHPLWYVFPVLLVQLFLDRRWQVKATRHSPVSSSSTDQYPGIQQVFSVTGSIPRGEFDVGEQKAGLVA